MKIIVLLSLFAIVGCDFSTAEECINYEEMEFFNSISGTLELKLTQQPESMKNLPGNKIAGNSEIVSIKFSPEVYVEETESFRQLTDGELNSIAFNYPTIELTSLGNETVKHNAKNGKYFTVQELLNAVELTEKLTRKKSEWFGGVDIHHIFFEGIYCEEEKRVIVWGS